MLGAVLSVKSDFRTNFGERWSVMVPGKRSAHTAEEARVRENKKNFLFPVEIFIER